METTNFIIKDSKLFEFYTKYIIEYKGVDYTCNFNGGLPKLEGNILNEKLRYELGEVIEDYFIMGYQYSK
jgi:hypothetical protein